MKNKGIIYVLALAVFLIGTIEYIITGVIEIIAADLGVSTSEAGLLVTVFALAAAIIAPVLITLTINMDRKRLLMTTLGVFIASNGLMFADLSYETVIGIRMIQGASGGMATVVAMALATRLVEKEKRGNAIGIILMGLSSSLVLGVPLGTFFSEMFGWRVLFVLVGALSVLPLLVIHKKIPAIKEEEKITLSMQLSVLKNPTILMALVVTLFYIGGYATLFTYITPFLQMTSSLHDGNKRSSLSGRGLQLCRFKVWGPIGRYQGIEIHHFAWPLVTRGDPAVIRTSGSQYRRIHLDIDDFYVSNVEYFPGSATLSGYAVASKSGHCP